MERKNRLHQRNKRSGAKTRKGEKKSTSDESIKTIETHFRKEGKKREERRKWIKNEKLAAPAATTTHSLVPLYTFFSAAKLLSRANSRRRSAGEKEEEEDWLEIKTGLWNKSFEKKQALQSPWFSSKSSYLVELSSFLSRDRLTA